MNRQQYAKKTREKAIQQTMNYGYNRKTAEESFDGVTEMVYSKYPKIDEYSPIIRHANESLYGCGMLDRILTAEDLKALGKA